MGLLDGISDTDEVTFEKMDAEIQAELGITNTPDPTPQRSVAPQITNPEPLWQQAEPEQTVQEQEVSAELSEVEKRLAKAQLYKQFITGDIFSGDDSTIVREVSKEFQDFARQQLQILMGIVQPAKAQSTVLDQFTDEELSVLKIFIARIIKNSTKQTAAPKPVAKPVVAQQPKPAPRPAQVQPQKPTLRRREVPEEVATAPKPRTSSLDKIPARKPTISQTKPETLRGVYVPFPASLLPADGSVVEENGQRARIKHGELSGVNEYGLMDGARISKLQEGYAVTLSNDIQVAKIGGSLIKVTKTYLPSNTDVPGRLPYPSIDQMELITAQQSTLAAQALGNRPIVAPPTVNSMLGR